MSRRATLLGVIGRVDIDIKTKRDRIKEEGGKWKYRNETEKRGKDYGKESGKWKVESSSSKSLLYIKQIRIFSLHCDVPHVVSLPLYKGIDQSDKRHNEVASEIHS